MHEMKKITGDVTFNPSVDYSEVEEITGGLYCRGADTKAAFPKLTTVGGGLYCSGAGTKAAFPKLTTVGGGLYCRRADTKAAFPKLTTVGGGLDCRGAGTKAAFPKLTTVGGWLYCRGAGTKAAFPKLTTVGGGLYCRGAGTKAAFPKLRKTDTGSAVAERRVRSAFRRKRFLLADGVLSKIADTRVLRSGAKVHKVVVIGKTRASYCIEADGVFSHGDTLKEARESLLYKVGERDKSVYEGWTLGKKITKKQAIESYCVITGACEAGVRHFVETHGKLKARYTVREVIAATKGQYGNKEYAAFFGGGR